MGASSDDVNPVLIRVEAFGGGSGCGGVLAGVCDSQNDPKHQQRTRNRQQAQPKLVEPNKVVHQFNRHRHYGHEDRVSQHGRAPSTGTRTHAGLLPSLE